MWTKLGVVAVALAGSMSPPATTLTVTVRATGSNQPISGAAVCIFPSAGGPQFGVRTSDPQGVARFTGLPSGDWILRAWKSDRRVGQTTILVNENTQPLISRGLALSPGQDANPCTVAPAFGTATALIAPNSFSIGLNDPQSIAVGANVILIARFPAGFTPTHWRASEVSRTAVETANWRPYVVDAPGAVPYGQFTSAGRRTIWFQAKSARPTGEALTTIVEDSVDVHREAVYDVTDVAGLARHAKANGFTVVASVASAQQCPVGAVGDADFTAYVYKPTPELLTSTMRWFVQGALRPGWRIDSMTAAKVSGWNHVTGVSTLRVIKTNPSPADSRFTLEMKIIAVSDPGSSVACYPVRAGIDRVRLVGPEGRNWRDAFTR
jgi:hypothetical protein